MQLSHECPICMMELVSKYIDFNYYLDVLMLDRDYNRFMNNGKRIYLDCSLYERTRQRSIEPLDEGIYRALFEKLSKHSETFIVVPDKHDSSEYNISKVQEYADTKNKIIAVHGKDLNDYISCLKYYIDNEDGIIALSAGDSFCDYTTRTRVLEKVDVRDRKIHLFGLVSPKEMYVLKDVKDIVYSMDTSLPVTCTLKGLKIQDVTEKPRIIIFDEFNNEHYYESSLLIDNIMFMRDFYGLSTI